MNWEAFQNAVSPANDESRRVDPFLVLKGLAEVSIVVGAGLFVIGWSYLYGYYHGFGLSASELSFSPQAVLIHSLPVIKTPHFLLTAIGIIFALFLLSLLRVLSPLRRPFVILILALLAIVVCSQYAGTTGRANAKRDVFLSTSTLPYVKLYGTEEFSFGGCDLDEWNYRLLLRANGQIYVILPIDNSGDLVGTNLRVCSFPESQIQAVRIQVGLEKGR
jgi:hypothetical protein